MDFIAKQTWLRDVDYYTETVLSNSIEEHDQATIQTIFVFSILNFNGCLLVYAE